MMILTIKRGKGRGRKFQLDGESMVIGRDTSADIALPDETASRKHAEIFRIGEMYLSRTAPPTS